MKTNRTRHFNLFILTTLAVALLGIRFLGPAISRAQTSQDPATQTAKPFDQAQALENLRKTIAGQENKPAEEVSRIFKCSKECPQGGFCALWNWAMRDRWASIAPTVTWPMRGIRKTNRRSRSLAR
jgi:hypothetical protein